MSSILDKIKEAGAKAESSREATIVKTSVIGILANVFLAGFKAVVGLMTHSIAIVLDAVNNISDAASSLITIIGTRLAGKEPDKKHPFGYGRIEYLSAMIIALLVLYAGITAFSESVKAILHPSEPDYTPVTLVIVAVGVLVKILLGRYVKKTGERVHSDSLVNSGEDASMDAIISASTLVAAVLWLLLHISLEAWLGAVIAAFIIRSGITMLRDTLSELLGERAGADLAREIRGTVCSFDEVARSLRLRLYSFNEVEGAYDLVLNNYGPDAYNGSIHIEVADTLTAAQLDPLIRRIQVEVHRKHGVILTAIGVYSVNTTDPETVAVRGRVREIALSQPHITQMHGFALDKAAKTLRFDLVVSFDAADRREAFCQAVKAVQDEYPGYRLEAALDTDFSEA